jgi:NADPH-dependent curcumin reductase CurA
MRSARDRSIALTNTGRVDYGCWMADELNTRVVLVRRPVGVPQPDDFRVERVRCEAPNEGGVSVDVHFIDVQPAMRGWLAEQPAYTPPIPLGGTMRAQGVGRVVTSRDTRFNPGDYVMGPNFGVQSRCVVPADELTLVDPELAPLHEYVGALGSSGLTAFFGLFEVGSVKPGDIVLVSSAAGAVGSVAGQIAKLLGCRVVGIAGGREKCAYLIDELGFDGAVDYKASDALAALRAQCPDGIDLYFDNVGGALLDGALLLLRKYARVVISGMLSQYNETVPYPLHAHGMLLVRHARMEGFLVRDYLPDFARARAVLAAWLSSGKIRTRSHVLDGVAAFPEALPMLFDGRSLGKLMLRVRDSA